MPAIATCFLEINVLPTSTFALHVAIILLESCTYGISFKLWYFVFQKLVFKPRIFNHEWLFYEFLKCPDIEKMASLCILLIFVWKQLKLMITGSLNIGPSINDVVWFLLFVDTPLMYFMVLTHLGPTSILYTIPSDHGSKMMYQISLKEKR